MARKVRLLLLYSVPLTLAVSGCAGFLRDDSSNDPEDDVIGPCAPGNPWCPETIEIPAPNLDPWPSGGDGG
jgi:hypothetical protein